MTSQNQSPCCHTCQPGGSRSSETYWPGKKHMNVHETVCVVLCVRPECMWPCDVHSSDHTLVCCTCKCCKSTDQTVEDSSLPSDCGRLAMAHLWHLQVHALANVDVDNVRKSWVRDKHCLGPKGAKAGSGTHRSAREVVTSQHACWELSRRLPCLVRSYATRVASLSREIHPGP